MTFSTEHWQLRVYEQPPGHTKGRIIESVEFDDVTQATVQSIGRDKVREFERLCSTPGTKFFFRVDEMG